MNYYASPPAIVVPSTKPGASSAGEQNSRFEVVSWPITREGVVHGFSGFFECVLYGNVTMSTYEYIICVIICQFLLNQIETCEYITCTSV